MSGASQGSTVRRFADDSDNQGGCKHGGRTVEDAVNVVNVLGDLLAQDANDDVRNFVMAVRQLVT